MQPIDPAVRSAAVGSPGAGPGSGGVHVENLDISIPMTGFADFTDPNSLDMNARRMAAQIRDAIKQIEAEWA